MSDRDAQTDELRAALERVTAPTSPLGLVTAGLVEHMTHCDGAVKVTLSLPLTEKTGQALTQSVKDEVGRLGWVEQVKVESNRKIPGAAQELGTAGSPIKHVIAVASGKGGVGKSTMAVNLAVTMARLGHKVGLLDADIYGPSIPTMLGKPNAQPPMAKSPTGQPLIGTVEAHGVSLVSMGFLVEGDQPIIWRGPKLHGALKQFFTDVAWGELDFLFVDMPPGTGDVALTLVQTVQLTGAVVVSTPQEVAMIDARKALNMFRETNIHPLGVIENMSGPIFGEGATQAWAEREHVPFLGGVPLEVAVREGGDAGKPAATSADAAVRAPFEAVAEALNISVAQRVANQPERPGISLGG